MKNKNRQQDNKMNEKELFDYLQFIREKLYHSSIEMKENPLSTAWMLGVLYEEVRNTQWSLKEKHKKETGIDLSKDQK